MALAFMLHIEPWQLAVMLAIGVAAGAYLVKLRRDQ
jgi:hypothetical protein